MRETMHGSLQDALSKKPAFDSSINIATMIAIITMAGAGVSAWTALDKRVVVLEEAKVYQATRDAGIDARINEKFETIKENTREISAGLYQLQRDGRDRDRAADRAGANQREQHR